MSAIQTKAVVVERQDAQKFEADLNMYLNEGYQILSCSCGFVNSERYDFCSDYKAVLVLSEKTFRGTGVEDLQNYPDFNTNDKFPDVSYVPNIHWDPKSMFGKFVLTPDTL